MMSERYNKSRVPACFNNALMHNCRLYDRYYLYFSDEFESAILYYIRCESLKFRVRVYCLSASTWRYYNIVIIVYRVKKKKIDKT